MRHPCTPIRHAWNKRALSLLLAFVLILGLVPGFPLLGSETVSAHWADTYMDDMVEYGFIQPNHDPDGLLTRADFMATVNRAYGYTQNGPTPFEDIEPTDWFYDDVGIAYTARYIHGTSPTTAAPNQSLDRETAATILGRNMMLKESEGEILDFFDSHDISSWAKGTIKSSLEHYLVNGYDDGTFQPQREMTWGEMAAMVTRIVGTPIQEPGDYTLGGVYGNVTITSEGVTLRDSIIAGDLYVTGGVGLGDIKLENVTVLGRIITSGTGESQDGQASIVLRNVIADELLVDNLQKNFVTVQVDGITEIGKTTVRTDSYLEDNTPEGLGLKNIYLEGDPGVRLDLAGRIENVFIKTPGAQVNVAKGTVASMTVDEEAPGTNVTISRGAVITLLNLDTGAYVSGDGDIKELFVNAEGAIVTMLPEKVHIRPGITAVIHNQIMDSTAAEEASRSPMLLAGYPLANDIAPTSFQAVFATNKKGTVYWAVSAIADGSVETDDLIHKPAYGDIAAARGSVSIPEAEELVGATVTGLTTGESYYLAAVFVDDRGEQSPTKVIALTLPDGSIPAFAESYPYMSLVSADHAQATVMATKDCILYYVLLPEKAQAPTENDFRTNSISGNLGFGTRVLTKNVEDVFDVNDQRLEEETTYKVYFWLTDADGINKSTVYGPLTFKTPDETPPEFETTPYITETKGKNASFGYRLSEAGTVYWVIVPQGANFPRPKPESGQSTIALTDEYAFQQVINHIGDSKIILAYGTSKVKAKGEVGVIKASGLESDSAYTLYYLAEDLAGNKSTAIGKFDFRTEDSADPTVAQYFESADGERIEKNLGSGINIILEFSENVQYYPDGTPVNGVDGRDFYTLASGGAATAAALARVLAQCITIYDTENSSVPAKTNPAPSFAQSGEDVVIDFTKVNVTLDRDTSHLVVTIPNDALKLKAGHTYFFVIRDIADTAESPKSLKKSSGQKDKTGRDDNVPWSGVQLPNFAIDPPSVKLEHDGPSDSADWPYKRNTDGTIATSTAEGYKPLINSEEYPGGVDFFEISSEGTSTVDIDSAFDVLIAQNKTAEYDLFYRILGEDDTVITSTVESQYLLSTSNTGLSAATDGNGWIYLGRNNLTVPGTNNADEVGYGSTFKALSLSLDFLKYSNMADLPRLRNLMENSTYQFAIVLHSLAGKTDYGEMIGTINFAIGVAGEEKDLLYTTLRQLKDPTAEDGWAVVAGADPDVSLISTPRRTTSKLPDGYKGNSTYETNFKNHFLFVSMTLNGTSPLLFQRGNPTFTVTGSSSAEMNIRINTTTDAGFYYYLVEASDENGYIPGERLRIPTTVEGPAPESGAGEEWHGITPAEVPINGSVLLPANGDRNQPEKLLNPDSNEVRDYAVSNDGRGDYVDYFVNALPDPIPFEDLKASTTYYVYIVLATSKYFYEDTVYIFQFTTNEAAQPETRIAWDGDLGILTLSTHIRANGAYAILAEGPITQYYEILLADFYTGVNNNVMVRQEDGRYAVIGRPVDETDDDGGWLVPEGYIWKNIEEKELEPGEDYDTYIPSGDEFKANGTVYIGSDPYTILEILSMTTDYSQSQARDNCITHEASDRTGTTTTEYYTPWKYPDRDTIGYTAFDVYASESIRQQLRTRIASATNTLVPPSSIKTEDADGRWWSKSVLFDEDTTALLNSQTFYVLFYAEDLGAADYNTAEFDSFRAFRFDPTDNSAPDILTDDTAVFQSGKITGNREDGFGGTITFNFDKPLHINTGSKLPTIITDDAVLPFLERAVNPSGSLVFSDRGAMSFTLEISGIDIGTGASIGANTFYNSLGTASASQALVINLVRDGEATPNEEDPSMLDVYGHFQVIWGRRTWDLGVFYLYSFPDPNSGASGGDITTAGNLKDPAIVVPAPSTSSNTNSTTTTPSTSTTATEITFEAVSGGENLLKKSGKNYALTLDESKGLTSVDISKLTGGPVNPVSYKWTSDDESIVSVSGSNTAPKLTAKGIGKAKVTLTITGRDGSTKTKAITVTTKGDPTVDGKLLNDPGGSFQIKKSSKSGIDYEVTWTATSSTKNAELDIGLGSLTNTAVTWTVTSGSSYVKFSGDQKTANGPTATLRCLGSGTAKIKVTAGTVSKVIQVTVKDASGPNLNVAG